MERFVRLDIPYQSCGNTVDSISSPLALPGSRSAYQRVSLVPNRLTEMVVQQFVHTLILPPLFTVIPHQLGLWEIELSRTKEPQKSGIVVLAGDEATLFLELFLELVKSVLLWDRQMTKMACKGISWLIRGHRFNCKVGR